MQYKADLSVIEKHLHSLVKLFLLTCYTNSKRNRHTKSLLNNNFFIKKRNRAQKNNKNNKAKIYKNRKGTNQ